MTGLCLVLRAELIDIRCASGYLTRETIVVEAGKILAPPRAPAGA